MLLILLEITDKWPLSAGSAMIKLQKEVEIYRGTWMCSSLILMFHLLLTVSPGINAPLADPCSCQLLLKAVLIHQLGKSKEEIEMKKNTVKDSKGKSTFEITKNITDICM